jgi:hypothetical protein
MFKIKCTKDDTIFTDGRYISDGRWLIDSNYVPVKVSSKAVNEKIQDALDNGTEWCAEGRKVPNCERVVSSAQETFDSEVLLKIGEDKDLKPVFTLDADDLTKVTTTIFTDGTNFCALNRDFSFMWENDCELYHTGAAHKPIMLVKNHKLIGLLMPVNRTDSDVLEPMEQLLKALGKEVKNIVNPVFVKEKVA